MNKEQGAEVDFGVAHYILSRWKYNWPRYTLMATVLTLCVVIFLIVLSLFSGLLIFSGNGYEQYPLTTDLITRQQISDTEAYALSGWLIIAASLIFCSSIGTIYNTIRCSVLFSKKDIAILKAIGLSQKEISKIFIFEALWLSLISWAVGLIIGLIISNQFIYHFYVQNQDAMFFAPSKTLPSIVILSFILTFLVAYLGARGPAKNASRLNPIEAMGQVEGR